MLKIFQFITVFTSIRFYIILQKHLPKRDVIGVDCRKLIWGLGAIHCFTQQQPKF